MSRTLVVVALVLGVVLPVVQGHNWVGSPSRARFAAVTRPCQIRVDPQPHIQVGPGQTFEMEWTVGHGDTGTKWMYWVAVHSDDYMELNNILSPPTIIEEYIQNAPGSAYKYNGTAWKKRHIGQIGDPFVYGYFPETPLNQTAGVDADFIKRDDVYNRRKYQFSNNKYNEWMFYPNCTSNDVRVEYTYSKYPWILSAHKFRNSFAEHQPFAHQFDLARFVMPTPKGPGDYIYFFYWGGYRDCVDINIQPAAVTNRYGVYNTSATTTFVKLEHCQYYYMFNPITQCNILPSTRSVDQCLTQCRSSGSCTGVQVARAKNPTTTLQYTVGIPYWWHNVTAMDFNVFPPAILGPCGSPSLHVRNISGCDIVSPTCNKTKLNPADDDLICYGLQPYRDQDFQAIDDYLITNDAADPRFYGTCWVKVPNSGFIPIPQPTKPTPKWDVGDTCLSCSFTSSVQALTTNYAADWSDGFTDTCINCDKPTL